VRRDGHEHPAGDARVQDGAAGGQRVRRGPGGRADDEAVGAQVGDEVPPTSIFSSTMLAVAPRLTMTSFTAKPSKITSPSRHTLPSSIVRRSSS
jgi:hypothetical protein